MAYYQTYGDTSYFNPARSFYPTAAAEQEVLRNAALQKAAYLSEMDTTYAQLQQQLDLAKMDDATKRELARMSDKTSRIGIATQSEANANQRYGMDLSHEEALRQLQLKEEEMYLTNYLNQQQLALSQRDQNQSRLLEFGLAGFTDKDLAKYLGNYNTQTSNEKTPMSGLPYAQSKGGSSGVGSSILHLANLL